MISRRAHLRAAGDFGLEHEPRPAVLVGGVALLDFLEGYFAMELAVLGHRDFAETAARMRPQNAKSQAVGAIERMIRQGCV